MKNMVVLIDTNVLLDYLETREPYFEDSYHVLLLCAEEKAEGYMAFHSVPNIFYIMRRTHDRESRRELFNEICNILTVAGASHEKIVDAINREDFPDLEDCLQVQCAREIQADYIVTRNVNDFAHSEIEAVTPKEFIKKMENIM